ncbi:substrate-binding periplasmic protein [Tateyamaria sp. SN3-11]|uniref:substrate-binding periplasmic protein n=1 Tax=Tateyamaria sp. SN3-11 TaxID=3092147 RepID=UPI0039ECFF22
MRTLNLISRYVRTTGHTLVAAIVLSIGMLAGAAQAQTQTGVDQVVSAYYPPLMINEHGDTPGLAIEILQAAAKRAGRKINIEFMPFQRALHRLQNDPSVMMPALFRNPEREEKFEWIAQIHATQVRFISLENQIDTLDEARDLGAIGVEAGASTEAFLAERGFENLRHVGTPDATAQMLRSKRVDAWFLTEPLARGAWRRLGFEEELIVGDVIFEQPIFLVCHVDFPLMWPPPTAPPSPK